MNAAIETRDLCYTYEDGTVALDHISLKAQKGKITGILGANGAGKSTLFLNLNGVLSPASGQVLLDGAPVRRDRKGIAELRRRVGIVFQDPDDQLFSADVYRDVSFGAVNLGLDEGEVRRRVEDALARTGISHLRDKPTHALSFGQKKRAAIAGVLVMEPEVLILDEPTAGLDPEGVESILGNIRDYHRAHNATIILVSHSMEEMARTVDRLVVVNDGKLPFQGTPREVFQHGDELERMGLGVPQLTRVFHRLRALGVDIDPSVYTLEQAKGAVLDALGKRGKALEKGVE